MSIKAYKRREAHRERWIANFIDGIKRSLEKHPADVVYRDYLRVAWSMGRQQGYRMGKKASRP